MKLFNKLEVLLTLSWQSNLSSLDTKPGHLSQMWVDSTVNKKSSLSMQVSCLVHIFAMNMEMAFFSSTFKFVTFQTCLHVNCYAFGPPQCVGLLCCRLDSTWLAAEFLTDRTILGSSLLLCVNWHLLPFTVIPATHFKQQILLPVPVMICSRPVLGLYFVKFQQIMTQSHQFCQA